MRLRLQPILHIPQLLCNALGTQCALTHTHRHRRIRCLPFFSSPLPLFLFLPGSTSTGKCLKISPSPRTPERSVSADVYNAHFPSYTLIHSNQPIARFIWHWFTACCSSAASSFDPQFSQTNLLTQFLSFLTVVLHICLIVPSFFVRMDVCNVRCCRLTHDDIIHTHTHTLITMALSFVVVASRE